MEDFAFAGSFDFEKDGTQIGVAATITTFELKAGTKTLVTLAGIGAMLINDDGLACHVTMSATGAPSAIPELSVSGTFTLRINTTGAAVAVIAGVTLPEELPASSDYLFVHVAGTLTVEDFAFAGSFDFEKDGTQIEVAATITTFELKAGTDPNANTLVTLQGQAALLISDDGVACYGDLNVKVGTASEVSGVSVTEGATGGFTLKINTTGDVVNEIINPLPTPLPGGDFYVMVHVEGTLNVENLALEGSFGFEMGDDFLGVSASFGIEFKSGDEVVFGFSCDGAILIKENGAAMEVGISIDVGTSTGPFEFAGSGRFFMNTTGEDVTEIAGTPVDLVIPVGKDKVLKVKIPVFKVKIGDYVTFEAGDIVLDLTATGQELLITFGEGGLSVKFGSGVPFLDGFGGSVGNFGIRADFLPIILPNFYVTLSFGNVSTTDFKLPIPIKLTEIGVRFKDGAISNEGVLEKPGDFVLTLSGGLDGTGGFPITALVDGLEVDIGLLVAGGFPFTKIDGVQFGIDDMSLGPVKVGGMFTFGVVEIDDGAGGTKKAFYGGIEGSFSYSGIGGGLKLYVCEYGPLVATISVGGLVLGPTGFVLGVEDGGFAFGGAPWPSVDSPEDLLTNPIFAEPIDTSLDAITAAVETALSNGVPTWNESFTMAVTGTVTNLYVQGMIEGNVTIAANIGSGPDAGLKLLVNGDISVLGMPMGFAALLLDLSNPLVPQIDLAYSVPAPNNPLGFLFPSQTTVLASLDTKGILEMPIVGLGVFISEAFEGTLKLLVEDIAQDLEND
ncbi:MAG: hypothetical protein ACYSYL_17660, partial [Planctomycetota bacterium]